MKMRICFALACIVLTNQAVAHHNFFAMYNFNDRVSLQGTLTKFDWRNPHTYMTVEVKASDGGMETWLVEGPPPAFYRIRNFDKADFVDTIGKTVKVELSRSRDKSKSGLIRTLVLPNKKVLSACPQIC